MGESSANLVRHLELNGLAGAVTYVHAHKSPAADLLPGVVSNASADEIKLGVEDVPAPEWSVPAMGRCRRT
jgi:hypothetical protein